MTTSRSLPWFLGIDLGTGSCKSTIIDENAQALGFGACSYSAAGDAYEWQEQDPEGLVEAIVCSVRSAVESAGMTLSACLGVGMGGALHSLLAVDSKGRPLTGIITWVDNRASRQAQSIQEAGLGGEIYSQTGCPVHSIYPLSKLIWLREERTEVFRSAARFISGKEYAIQRLTGEWSVDYGVASGSGLLNIHSLDWDTTALDLAGIDRKQLSTLCNPRRSMPRLRPEMANLLGLSVNTPLVIGSSDAANSSLGAGAVRPGQATCMIGTSAALRLIASNPVLDTQQRSWCYAVDEQHWLVGGALNNGGLALAWLRDLFNGAGRAVPARVSFEDLVQDASQVEAGAHGVICLPFFTGERSPNWNMQARAVFFGLTLQHDVRHLARSVLEGVAYRLRSVEDVLLETGAEIEQIRASGGFTHSAVWLQIIASVLERELIVPTWGETSSLGAALWPLLGAGAARDLQEAGSKVSLGNRYFPDPTEVECYQLYYPIYLDLYQKLRDSFARLAKIQGCR